MQPGATLSFLATTRELIYSAAHYHWIPIVTGIIRVGIAPVAAY